MKAPANIREIDNAITLASYELEVIADLPTMGIPDPADVQDYADIAIDF